MHPGKNRELLLIKRNALLDRLQEEGKLDPLTCKLAKEETIPDAPVPLPRLAHHLLTRASKEGFSQERIKSSIDISVQQRAEEILAIHHQRLKGNQIHNSCAIVADVQTGAVIAYIGNTATSAKEGRDVDIVMSARSTGSILKPILYAAALDEGKILQSSLLPDIPAYLNGFTPKNFTHDYDGAVPADKALIRSLNIPAVFLLKDYRYEKFHALLKNTGLTSLGKGADHYGLSIILGGAEGKLWDIAGVYASMARTLNSYFEHPGKNKYNRNDFHPLHYLKAHIKTEATLDAASWLSASAIYQTFDVLKELHRPGEESGWRHFQSSKPVAWKTGTSFGFRDAWAVGVTPRHVVAVWVGNADGEGRPGLTGVDTAAPVMFDLFSHLSGDSWFRKPMAEMQKVSICRKSGYRNSGMCATVDTVWATARGTEVSTCPFHKRIHLSKDKRYRVNSQCAEVADMVEESWFVLPHIQEYYFRSKNLSYKSLPPFQQGCASEAAARNMDFVYPKAGARLFIPRGVEGKPGSAVFQLAHRNPATRVHWYLDGNYEGSTQRAHHLAVNPPSGKHVLVIIDDEGETLEQPFEVLSDL
jgi:penicillin-binding protein 1C